MNVVARPIISDKDNDESKTCTKQQSTQKRYLDPQTGGFSKPLLIDKPLETTC